MPNQIGKSEETDIPIPFQNITLCINPNSVTYEEEIFDQNIDNHNKKKKPFCVILQLHLKKDKN